MNITKTLTAGAAALTLALGMSLSTSPAIATSTTTPTSTSTVAEAPTWEFRFNLLVPNGPVTFTVDGKVVGTGTTNSNGDVSFFYSTAGLKPGYYKLYAHTSYGIWSSSGFGVPQP